MIVTIETASGTLPVRTEPGLAYAFVDVACPACGAPAPFKVAGHDRRIASHDTYAADARALCCNARVGTLKAKIETLFGLEEDAAVLVHGRARVYG